MLFDMRVRSIAMVGRHASSVSAAPSEPNHHGWMVHTAAPGTTGSNEIFDKSVAPLSRHPAHEKCTAKDPDMSPVLDAPVLPGKEVCDEWLFDSE
ncbi:MAG TPA: hypothetical protein VF516_00535 [Kofleriaceae bacterium]